MNQKELIENLLEYRKEHNIFQKSIDQRSNNLQAITYDGPPFASGTPHFGHGLVGAMKDLVGRYKTMKGYQVIRDWGRDCHGLPVEKAVEKKLGIDGKKDIEEKIGIDKFTQECRNYVSNVSGERDWFVDHIGRRADMDHAYMTMNLDFMESVINVFDNLYSQNLVYKGFRIQRYCPSCATSLSNSEVNEGYEDRQDPAVTVKFQLNGNKKQIERSEKNENNKDGSTQYVRAVIKNEKGEILQLQHNKLNAFVGPGGRVDKGETPEIALERELKEEIGVSIKQKTYLGSIKNIFNNGFWLGHFYEVTVEGEISNIEKDIHPQLVWAKIEDSDNKLGFQINIQGTIVDDAEKIIDEFYDLYVYHNNISAEIAKISEDNKNTPVNLLAWTTTPWTLPSNSFLAVGKFIKYILVFDKNSKEYYILAEKLLQKYYKNPEEYIIINIFNGEHLEGFNYEPLFEYINQSEIADEYKSKYFQIILGDYVSTSDGTGIVHIAPAFGQDDFDIVAGNIFPREHAKDRLFLPVDDYGEFTDQVPDYKGIRVYDANKDINKVLKDNGKLVFLQSYTHSYPHCRRCKTALISKAMDSWFIKEPSLKNLTLPNAEKIGFVPETIKKRFHDTLDSAPDWNLSRNRYRGSPIPVWINDEDQEDRLSIGTLDELFQNTKNGSQNLTKNIFIRHGRTNYNEENLGDSYGDGTLTEQGKQQAEELNKNLQAELKEDKDFIVILSPLKRTFETITPFLINQFGEDKIADITTKYLEIVTKFQNIYNDKKLIEYMQDDNSQKLFEIAQGVFVDMRLHEIYYPSLQKIKFECGGTTQIPTDQKLFPDGEMLDDVFARTDNYIKDINEQFKTKTIITVSHGDTLVALQKYFRKFDYKERKKEYYPKNGEIKIHYYDNTTHSEIDLHRPHVDNYRFNLEGKIYHRIPEVMDCRFESGSMPFGQVGFIKRKDGTTRSHKPLIYPANRIMEGLDQTRGWFRVMHVLGNAMMGQNSFDNVVVNGLILAEDGHKMSKSLNNYPDPAKLFDRYGTDAYRLYVLSSPSVKAEPMRFSERGVDQVYKDFTASLTNAYKFFETYAKVDNFKTDDTSLYFMRHSDAAGFNLGDTLTDEGIQKLKSEKFITDILRLELNKIYASHATRTMQTAKTIQEIYKTHLNIDLEIIQNEKLRQENASYMKDTYQDILNTAANSTSAKAENILIVSHDINFEELWTDLCGQRNTLNKAEIIKLPNYTIANDLDKRILAELNKLGLQVEEEMNAYHLDNATKFVIGFVDKLTNRYIRRSRRRFWASGMDAGKLSAYNTLFEVLNTFVKISAPFAPFISEHIFLNLKTFTNKGKTKGESVHLKHFPISSDKYIDKKLLSEIELVRKVISLGLFIRAKNKQKIKQPLAKMEIKIN